MSWVKRINSVLDYIEDNLDGDINDNKISSLFASPHGMFQRIFANITNMTLSEYIRKRRLTQAAVDLKGMNEKIIDVAIKYGYNSAVAFSSAFKNFHGVTPSEMKKSGTQFKVFHRFAFTLILSEKGSDSMQYYNTESAEYLMQKVVNEKHEQQYLRCISEHNGVKCTCDGFRVCVILPEGVADWDLTDAYFDTGDNETPKFEFNKVFNHRAENGLNFNLSKEQVALLLISIDGAQTEHKRKYISLSAANSDSIPRDALIHIDMDTMGILTETTANQLEEQANEPIIGFNAKFIEEAFKFIMCSNDGNIEVFYNGNLSALIIKSGCLYALVLPVKARA